MELVSERLSAQNVAQTGQPSAHLDVDSLLSFIKLSPQLILQSAA